MNPKRKGNQFERELAKILSKWYFKDEKAKDLIFWRDLGSGTTYLHNKSSKLCGDLICFLEDPRIDSLYIEAKYYSNFTLNDLNTLEKIISKLPEDKNSFFFIKCKKGIFIGTKRHLSKNDFFIYMKKYYVYFLKEVRAKYSFEEIFLN